MGIAFALNAAQVLGLPDSGAVLTAVVAGTLVSELIALIMAPAQAPLGHEPRSESA
jgi:Ca2+/Na+ antiporter